MIYTIDYIQEWLRNNLTEERYNHSLGTAEAAEMLAIKYGLDKEKAYFTGLIHDCAKCLPKDEMSKILEKVKLEYGELDNPKTHHAPAGAYLAKAQFGVEDEEILSAIRWHTIGKINMTLFEKIIFLADKIEERTRPKECIELKKLLDEENGIDKAILVCYKFTIKSLVDRNLTICTQTIDIYNNLLNSI
ncbi:bis(5'-nucleosyl)-tetraphosphatase (symmetrical) YqeK [bacterium]|nr:bis(5'-nucleosyl)-tetraphosphatase (symmetrical) YqeK [bacterium]